MTEVREDHFDVGENSVVHRPTNAKFWSSPTIQSVERLNWGRAGEVLPNGEEYDQVEVLTIAAKLLAERPSLKR
jgi:hypothetical protein